MKIAAYLATLFVRLLGIYLLFSSGSDLLALISGGAGGAVNGQLAVVPVLRMGVGFVAFVIAGRIVRLFTADAPLGND